MIASPLRRGRRSVKVLILFILTLDFFIDVIDLLHSYIIVILSACVLLNSGGGNMLLITLCMRSEIAFFGLLRELFLKLFDLVLEVYHLFFHGFHLL